MRRAFQPHSRSSRNCHNAGDCDFVRSSPALLVIPKSLPLRITSLARASRSFGLSPQHAAFVHSSLTVFACRRKHRVDHKCWEGKQPRIEAMKRILISAACAIFIFGTACAREVTAGPTFILHGASVVARRVAQLNCTARERLTPCTTMYVSTTRVNGSGATRQSVDCEE
jgi:hypothetical protein